MSEDRWRAFGDAVDDVVSLNLRGWGPLALVPAVRRAVRQQSSEPLTIRAAQLLSRSCVGAGSVVITTGFVFPPIVTNAETDGPVGAAVLATVLHRVFGVRPVFVTEPEGRDALAACMQALARPSGPVPPVQFGALPRGNAATRDDGDKLLADVQPAAVIAVEKAGMCADGTYRTASNRDISQHVLGVDPLFRAARDAGIATLSMGDASNEVGIGPLVAVAGAIGGVPVASTPAEATVVGTTANWAAYGVAACIAALQDQHGAMVQADETAAALEAALAAGAVDSCAVLEIEDGAVDGMSVQTDRAVVAMLGQLLAWARKWPPAA